MQLCLPFKHQQEKQLKKTHYVNVNFVDAKEWMIIVSKMVKPNRREKETTANYVKELIADVKPNKGLAGTNHLWTVIGYIFIVRFYFTRKLLLIKAGFSTKVAGPQDMPAVKECWCKEIVQLLTVSRSSSNFLPQFLFDPWYIPWLHFIILHKLPWYFNTTIWKLHNESKIFDDKMFPVRTYVGIKLSCQVCYGNYAPGIFCGFSSCGLMMKDWAPIKIKITQFSIHYGNGHTKIN